MRSWISAILDFYFLIDMPSVETIGDAFNIWSNNFKSGRQKAVNQLAAQIFDTHAFELADPGDKERALRTIGRVADRILLKWRDKFRIIGENIIQCRRAAIYLESDIQLSDKERFRRFQTGFNDVKKCRSQCRVDKFFLEHHKSEVKAYLQHASGSFGQPKKKNQGFIRIAKELKRVSDGERDFSCHLCKIIGDAVIALESSREMRLEHTDHSFDHLCEIIGQPHYKHLSEITLIKDENLSRRPL